MKIELDLTEEEWTELVEAVASKAVLVRSGHYGDFDPLDGFDPDHWAAQLEALHRKLSDRLEREE